MLQALTLGALAQVSLLLSGLFASWVAVPSRVIGWLAGFGAGALISAVTFDLIPQAESLGGLGLTVWLLIGAGVFVGGDWLVDRRFGGAVATPARATEAGETLLRRPRAPRVLWASCSGRLSMVSRSH